MARATKSTNRSKLYICIGENFKDNAPIGDCGETKTIMQWLIHLSHRDEQFLTDYFEGFSNDELVEYIRASWGKRLKGI